MPAVVVHSLTVLVVVHDADVGALVRRMLERCDCRVLVAVAAVDVDDVAGSAEIDLLLAEVAPSLDGRPIAERLRRRRPDLPVLYLSGWSDHPDYTELRAESILRQPFSRAELEEAIAAALDGAAGL